MAMDEPNVAAVTTADAAGDFAELYRSNYRRLVRALELAGATRALAEDLTQEAFVRTFRHWRRVREGVNPSGYPYRVAFRLLSRDRRTRAAAPIVLDAASAAGAGGAAGTDEVVAVRDDVLRALRGLTVTQRAAVVLCLCVGFTSEEAARALGMKAATVRKHIERARPQLRVSLG
jgi:RNA polymerase sigma factor (sigma-70 family)